MSMLDKQSKNLKFLLMLCIFLFMESFAGLVQNLDSLALVNKSSHENGKYVDIDQSKWKLTDGNGYVLTYDGTTEENKGIKVSLHKEEAPANVLAVLNNDLETLPGFEKIRKKDAENCYILIGEQKVMNRNGTMQAKYQYWVVPKDASVLGHMEVEKTGNSALSGDKILELINDFVW